MGVLWGITCNGGPLPWMPHMRRLRLGCPPQASDNARRWYGGVIRPFRTLAEKPWAPHHWNLRRWAFNKLFQIISFLLRKEYSHTHECSCEAPYFYTLLSILKYSSICKAIRGRIKEGGRGQTNRNTKVIWTDARGANGQRSHHPPTYFVRGGCFTAVRGNQTWEIMIDQFT